MATRPIHPANHLIDVAAALVPAVSAGWASARLAPLADLPGAVWMPVVGVSVFALAYLAMRRSGKAVPDFRIPVFIPPTVDDDGLLLETSTDDNILILDTPWYGAEEFGLGVDELAGEAEELLLDRPFVQLADLLLDDPLPPVPGDSRVVRLFAPAPMPTAGQLADRIDRHLGHAPPEPTGARECDQGYDALREALDELRRSLRRA